MLTLLSDIWNNLWLVLGSMGIGAVVSPQLQALWTKIWGTTSADVAALKQQMATLLQTGTLPGGTVATDVETLKTQLAQLQADITALKNAPAKTS